jgi:hypothetical protein
MRRKIVIPTLVVAILVAAAIALVAPSTTNARPAFVEAHVSCFIGILGRTYSGYGTVVETPTGERLGECHATLTSGTPVSETTRTAWPTYGTSCGYVVERPSGDADLICHVALV